MTARSVFADLLAGYRKEAGWTQAEAAQQFSMSKSLYQKIEACERKPQRDMADRADALFGLREVFLRIYKAALRNQLSTLGCQQGEDPDDDFLVDGVGDPYRVALGDQA
jgi:transcriptional regulator with XRE-family HTH domain